MAGRGGEGAINRKEQPPFLLLLHFREGGSFSASEFNDRAHTPRHLEIWTWMDCTLKELTQLMTQALPDIIPNPKIDWRCVYSVAYPDMNSGRGRGPKYIITELGTEIIGSDIPNEDGNPTGIVDDSALTLEQARFVIGDFVCVNIFPPSDLADEDAEPATTHAVRPPRGGYDRAPREYGRLNEREYAEPPSRGRENGFHPYERPHGRRGGRYADISRSHVPQGEWRRGDVPPGGGGGGGYRGGGRGRGRMY